MQITSLLVTQSKSKTQITRSVHCKFNCITVKYNGTQHGFETFCLKNFEKANFDQH